MIEFMFSTPIIYLVLGTAFGIGLGRLSRRPTMAQINRALIRALLVLGGLALVLLVLATGYVMHWLSWHHGGAWRNLLVWGFGIAGVLLANWVRDRLPEPAPAKKPLRPLGPIESRLGPLFLVVVTVTEGIGMAVLSTMLMPYREVQMPTVCWVIACLVAGLFCSVIVLVSSAVDQIRRMRKQRPSGRRFRYSRHGTWRIDGLLC